MGPHFKPFLSSPRHISRSFFEAQDLFQAHYFKFETLFNLSLLSPRRISRSFFQTQDLFQASSFKAQDIFEDHFFKPKTKFKLPLSSPFFQVLSCSSFAFTSSFTHAQKMRGANSKLTSKLANF
jgi:hypothetical protein